MRPFIGEGERPCFKSNFLSRRWVIPTFLHILVLLLWCLALILWAFEIQVNLCKRESRHAFACAVPQHVDDYRSRGYRAYVDASAISVEWSARRRTVEVGAAAQRIRDGASAVSLCKRCAPYSDRPDVRPQLHRAAGRYHLLRAAAAGSYVRASMGRHRAYRARHIRCGTQAGSQLRRIRMRKATSVIHQAGVAFFSR